MLTKIDDYDPHSGLRRVVHRAVGALEAFGIRGRSPLHIRQALSVWPHSAGLSADDADRVVLLLTTRCATCERPVELVPGEPEKLWRHVDVAPGPPHRAAPAESAEFVDNTGRVQAAGR